MRSSSSRSCVLELARPGRRGPSPPAPSSRLCSWSSVGLVLALLAEQLADLVGERPDLGPQRVPPGRSAPAARRRVRWPGPPGRCRRPGGRPRPAPHRRRPGSHRTSSMGDTVAIGSRAARIGRAPGGRAPPGPTGAARAGRPDYRPARVPPRPPFEVRDLVIRRGPVTAVDGVELRAAGGVDDRAAGPERCRQDLHHRAPRGLPAAARRNGDACWASTRPTTAGRLAPRVGLMLQPGASPPPSVRWSCCAQYASFFDDPVPPTSCWSGWG